MTSGLSSSTLLRAWHPIIVTPALFFESMHSSSDGDTNSIIPTDTPAEMAVAVAAVAIGAVASAEVPGHLAGAVILTGLSSMINADALPPTGGRPIPMGLSSMTNVGVRRVLNRQEEQQ